MKKSIIYYILLSFCMFSCEEMETVIDLDIPPHEPVLVLNGLLDTDTTANVVISHSVGAFSSGNPSFIHDAEVLLYKEGIFVDSLLPDMTSLIYTYTINGDSLTMYYYKSNYEPVNDANYQITVNHQDYSPISSETYIPRDIVLNNINIDTTDSDENNIGITFDFQDNPNKQNFYRLKLFTNCEKKGGYRFRGHGVMLSNDPSFGDGRLFEGVSSGYTFSGTEVVFNDDLFNGQNKNITLDLMLGKPKYSDDFYLEDEDFAYYQCDTILIEFSTFSDDTYSYYNSLDNHSEKGELGVFGGEVIPVYTNVENGLGVFISTNAQKIRIKP